VNRRRFLQAAVLGTAPAVLGAGLGTVVVRAADDDQGVGTGATSAPGLGVQQIVWSGERDVALTFDDGPDPELTPLLLDVLAAHHVPATFMLLGARAAERRDLVRRAAGAGHELGNHTWTHRSLATLDKREVEIEIARTAEVLGEPVRWFRPPRGVLTGAAAQVAGEHGYDILLWSCSGSMASLRSTPAVATHVIDRLHPGTVVLMHDGIGRAGFSRWASARATARRRRAMELAALPRILDHARDAGVRFVTMSELVTTDTQTTVR
jgi:peptidoglycan/xylan/chitin deacetylase (PgdA/CDA1 family)